MSNPSIKKNFAYNAILTVSNSLFPLLTFPYVTRVLGVEYFGVVNFVDSSIQYFITLSLLGINATAVREIVRTRIDRKSLSETFSSLLLMVLMTTILSLLILFACVQIIPKYKEHQELFYMGAVRILFSTLLVEWLFSGLENFRYITIRSILIKTLYVISIFIFVKESSDYKTYFLLTVLLTVGNALINLLYSRNFLSFTLRNINIKPYLSSFVILGFHQICTSLYNAFNISYLGIVADEVQVGYYSVAVKFFTIILAFFTAFTGVLIPRKTALLTEGKKNEFIDLTYKTIDILLAFSIPTIMVAVYYAPEIIQIIAGSGYEGAIELMRMLMPLLLVIGYEQIIITQTLLPLKKDKAILVNSILGGSVALLLNFLLVARLQAIGSAIVWISCELVVLCSAQFFVHKYIGLIFPINKLLIRITLILPIYVLVLLLGHITHSSIVNLLVGSFIIYFCYFAIENLLLKNEIISSLWRKTKQRFQ